SAKRVITPEELEIILGPEKFYSETAERTELPGVATGLAWTSAGGDLLFIEATRMQGKGGITLTGQLGDVMKESCQAALSYTRNKKDLQDVPEQAKKEMEFIFAHSMDEVLKSALEEDPFEKAAKNPIPPEALPAEQPQPGVRA